MPSLGFTIEKETQKNSTNSIINDDRLLYKSSSNEDNIISNKKSIEELNNLYSELKKSQSLSKSEINLVRFFVN
jgi:hypothetical protein